MAFTLTLTDDWDITLDAAGRLATGQGAYAVAQNVANATRLATEDAYFNKADGIPHFQTELGKVPNATVIRSRFNAAARSVAEVAEAKTTVTRFENRVLEGDIAITTTEGETIHVTI